VLLTCIEEDKSGRAQQIQNAYRFESDSKSYKVLGACKSYEKKNLNCYSAKGSVSVRADNANKIKGEVISVVRKGMEDDIYVNDKLVKVKYVNRPKNAINYATYFDEFRSESHRFIQVIRFAAGVGAFILLLYLFLLRKNGHSTVVESNSISDLNETNRDNNFFGKTQDFNPFRNSTVDKTNEQHLDSNLRDKNTIHESTRLGKHNDFRGGRLQDEALSSNRSGQGMNDGVVMQGRKLKEISKPGCDIEINSVQLPETNAMQNSLSRDGNNLSKPLLYDKRESGNKMVDVDRKNEFNATCLNDTVDLRKKNDVLSAYLCDDCSSCGQSSYDSKTASLDSEDEFSVLDSAEAVMKCTSTTCVKCTNSTGTVFINVHKSGKAIKEHEI